MVDGIVVVGARALHELVEVVRRVLLGLSACVIHCGDQRGVGRSAVIFSVLFAPLRGGALVLILALGLAFASASVGALWERCSLDASDKSPWSWAIRARTLVAAASVSVWPELLVYRRSVTKSRRGGDVASCATLGGCSGERVERFILCIPTPLVGRETVSRCRNADLSAC